MVRPASSHYPDGGLSLSIEAMPIPVDYQQQVLRHPMLSLFAPEIQARIMAEAQYREFHPAALVIRQNETAERFFMVLRGKVKLFRISADGKEKVVEIIQPGQTFAEAVMFMHKLAYPVYGETLEPVHLVSFSNRLMLQCLEQNPMTCLHLLGHLSIRLHQRLDELENLTLQNATQRFALYLAGLARECGSDHAELDLMLPKGLIAARLSIKPETLSRIMGTLREMDLIATQGRHISIPSVSRLLAEFSGGEPVPLSA
jgi:CRP/FNR family transcriptional regulator, dissimilatory nitrate respiration regulator